MMAPSQGETFMSMTSAPSRLIYFGDSLTDSGTAFALTDLVLTDPVPSSDFNYAMRFSDGPVYAEVAASLLGIGDESENFAIGAAEAVGSLLGADLLDDELIDAFLDPAATPAEIAFVENIDINLGAQVDRYIASIAGEAPEGSAASILIGPNDFDGFEPIFEATFFIEATILGGRVIAATLGAAADLLNAGIETVYVNNLFPADFFPAAQIGDPDEVDRFNTALAAYNTALELAALPFGDDVEIIDFAEIAEQIQADPTSFGLLDINNPLLFGSGGDPEIVDFGSGPEQFFAVNPVLDGLDLDQFAFFDVVHFTSALHGVIGSYQAAAIAGTLEVLSDGSDSEARGGAPHVVLAGAGDDAVFLGAGDDVGLGGLGEDTIGGKEDRDVISGGSGEDRVNGGSEADVVAGGEGDDLVIGGAGDDVLIDGLGSDTLSGGGGDDAFLYTETVLIGGAPGVDRDVIVGGGGDDTLYLALTEGTRAVVEAELATGGTDARLESIGVFTFGVENILFLEDRLDLAGLSVEARLGEADLWGLV
jgi:phospholipase/lecithinase/hemolysin